MPFLELKRRLAAQIGEHFKIPELDAVTILAELGSPPNPLMGHVALPCFKIAKVLKKPADKIAQELAQKLSPSEVTIQSSGPYANFRWATQFLFDLTISRILSEKDKYGYNDYLLFGMHALKTPSEIF